MTIDDDPFLPERKRQAAQDFSEASDPGRHYSRIAEDAEAIKDVRKIEERAERLRQRMRVHNERQKKQREDREAAKQTDLKTALTEEHPSPLDEKDRRRLSPTSVQADAQATVALRMEARMARIVGAEANMIEQRVKRSERERAARERIERARKRRRNKR